MARKQKHEEHENHERWLVSYADFITLLFAFFVVMYSVSSVNEGKYRVLSDALMASFRSAAKTLAPIQVGSSAKAPENKNLSFRQIPRIVHAPNLPLPKIEPIIKGQHGSDPLSELADRIEKEMARLIDEDLIAVRRSDRNVEIELKSNIIFPSGGVDLTPEARNIVQKIGTILRHFPNDIRVEGYTDDTPVQGGRFPSNWELSAARAAAVVRELIATGVFPHHLQATGFAQYRPVADNDTPEGRMLNRRVKIVVVENSNPEETRQNLYLSSISKDGIPESGFIGEMADDVPKDVTDQPGIERGSFPIFEVPRFDLRPIDVGIVSEIPEYKVERPKE